MGQFILLQLFFVLCDEYTYRIPNPYTTLVHQGKGMEYPR